MAYFDYHPIIPQETKNLLPKVESILRKCARFSALRRNFPAKTVEIFKILFNGFSDIPKLAKLKIIKTLLKPVAHLLSLKICPEIEGSHLN